MFLSRSLYSEPLKSYVLYTLFLYKKDVDMFPSKNVIVVNDIS